MSQASSTKNVGFISLKGGVGKTLLSVHFAWDLHDQGEEVVLVDGDPIEGCRKWSQRSEEAWPFPVLRPTDPRPKTGWRVFDTEAHPEITDLEALGDLLDLAVVPVTTNVDALDAALMILPVLQGRRAKVVAVINNAPPKNLPDAENMRAALCENGIQVAKNVLRNHKAYEYARNEGQPVYASGHRKGMTAWLEFTRLARELHAWQD